jgi:hypothetical protein
MVGIVVSFLLAYAIAFILGGTQTAWISAWFVLSMVVAVIDGRINRQRRVETVGHSVQWQWFNGPAPPKAIAIAALISAIGAVLGWFAYRGAFSLLVEYVQPVLERPHQPIDETRLLLPRQSGVWGLASLCGTTV